MNINDRIYELVEYKASEDVLYLFVSRGNEIIIKAVEYSFIQELNGRQVFNLGFGNYDFDSGSIADEVISNNGDTYMVFNTVLSTIPVFLNAYPDAIIMVRGSDSGKHFVDACRKDCRKKCLSACRNEHRRVGIYRNYINKHHEALCNDYMFFGSLLPFNEQLSFEKYIILKEYVSIFLIKKRKFIQ
jgi:hypothetical protein